MFRFSEKLIDFQSLRVACVYEISNEIDSRIYIGSTKNFAARFGGHRLELRKNKHRNRHLQRFHNKYGAESLKMRVLQILINPTKEQLIAAEQKYIDALNPEFNINRIADSRLGVKASEETRRKISQAKQNIRYSDEYKQKMSARLSGANNHQFGKQGWLSPNFGKKHKAETIEKMRLNHADFSGANNPNFGRKQKPEATVKARQTRRARQAKTKGYILIYKDNEFVGKGVSLYECAEIIGVDASSVRRAILNKRTCKGFSFVKEKAV
jgi:group I intron endonuclease